MNTSLPTGLKPGGTSVALEGLRVRAEQDRLERILATTPDNTNGNLASGYLINLFQNTFASSKGNIQGYIMAQVTTVDDRMSLFQGADLKGCLANSAVPFTLDLSAIDPILKVTLNKIQCYAPFGSDAATDAGEAFGQDGADSSLWVQATDDVATNGTAGVTYANVKNAGSTSASSPESVDGISMVFNPNTSANHGGTLFISRFIANPTNKTFELFIGSNGGLVNGMVAGHDTFLGTGFRMISDGNYIYADGTLCAVNDITQCDSNAGDWQAFNVCLDPTTVTPHTPATDCTALANSFTLNNSTASLTFQEITGDSNLTHSCGSGLVGPTDANAALALPVCKISQFASVATKYGS